MMPDGDHSGLTLAYAAPDWPLPATDVAVIARALSERVGLYGRPEAPFPWRAVGPDPAGVPPVFLVVEQVPRWLRARIPLRPNGATAWIRRSEFSLTETRYRIVVTLRERRLILHRGERVAFEVPVAVGRARTPTPTGEFYIVCSLRLREAHPLYGLRQLVVSGFSEVLPAFNGGDGQIAIHGTSRPDLLGGDVTAGCIRVHDDDASKLARLVPRGTPVSIRP